VPGPFYGLSQSPLMFGAVPTYSARHYFATLRGEESQRLDVLVIDQQGLVRTKTAHLPATEPPPSFRSRHGGINLLESN